MLIRNISDTALLAAVYRARENENPNPLFRDPFARRLAGERGEGIAKSLVFSEKNAWSWYARTYLFDQFIVQCLEQGCDMVINLAAGLDARPYRLALPAELQWVEVDLPDITDYKEEILRDEKPSCRLERVRLDLVDRNARRQFFERLAAQSSKALVITEGLVLYLSTEEVSSLATDLAAQKPFRYWLLDIVSPALLKLMLKKMGKPLADASAPLKYASAEGPDFFKTFGWQPAGVQSTFHTAGKLKRLPLLMSFFYQLQKNADGFQAKRPWAGACLLERSAR